MFFLQAALLIVLGVFTLGLAVWGGFALWFQLPVGTWLRIVAIVLWSLPPAATLALALVAGVPGLPGLSLRWGARAFVLAGIAMALWWSSIRPSHARDWADDVARMLVSQVQGDTVTLENVRNFDWRTETDYAVRWESRQYDLAQLVSADLLLSYWMGPAIAHTLVSFGFADGRRLVFSLEIRRERDEAFSALGGFFRKFETVIVAADETDIIRTRTNARGEDVYLYRLQLRPDQLRRVFLGYLERAAQLRERPRFYNTLTSNCTTIVFELARRLSPSLPLDYRLLLSGYFANYVFDQGVLTPGYSFAQLHAAGRITERALQDGPRQDYSKRIRQGVPGVSAAELR